MRGLWVLMCVVGLGACVESSGDAVELGGEPLAQEMERAAREKAASCYPLRLYGETHPEYRSTNLYDVNGPKFSYTMDSETGACDPAGDVTLSFEYSHYGFFVMVRGEEDGWSFPWLTMYRHAQPVFIPGYHEEYGVKEETHDVDGTEETFWRVNLGNRDKTHELELVFWHRGDEVIVQDVRWAEAY